MDEDLIHLPDINEIRELLQEAKDDIKEEIKQNPKLSSEAKLLNLVIGFIEDKVSGKKGVETFSIKDKIDLVAHINFLQLLLEDFFYTEENFDFDEDDEIGDLNGEEYEGDDYELEENEGELTDEEK